MSTTFTPWKDPELCPRGEDSIGEAFLRRVLLTPRNIAYKWRVGGVTRTLSFGEALARVIHTHEFLQQRGIRKGDYVALSGKAGIDWHLTDLALLSLGAIVVPIYDSASPSDRRHILAQSLAKTLAPITVENFEAPTVDAEERFARSVAGVWASDPATLIYTSGTTGNPKGVLLGHEQLVGEAKAISAGLLLDESDSSLSVLPPVHIMGRLETFLPLFSGGSLGFAEPSTLVSDLKTLAPTFFIGVPRIFEKLQARIFQNPNVRRAGDYGVNLYRGWRAGEPRRLHERVLLKLIDKLMWAKVRRVLGGRLKFAICGGAALGGSTEDDFELLGMPIYQGYGMTEAGGAVTIALPQRAKKGTVGTPLFGVNVRLASDGEVEISGPMVLKEYFRDPGATARYFTKDGWYRTGDLAIRDDEGFLTLVDRKKEIFVTKSGRKISPRKVEEQLLKSPYIAHGLVLGDGREFVSVLLSLNWEIVRAWAMGQGIVVATREETASHPKVQALLQRELDSANSRLASYEAVRAFRVLPETFDVKDGTLTSSMKVRRDICETRFQPLIREIYSLGPDA